MGALWRIWAVGEVADGHLARIGTELGTLGRTLAAESGERLVGIVVGAEPGDGGGRARRVRSRGDRDRGAAAPTSGRPQP